ncbi:VaFE repeat-containing surface-anchored protein [Corynebacterium macginleyi]|uniref:VaFE repeat-containing surface-anchored protein n=1 Tax=Corynebacterium macginleyi TaxID=38290 RepID=UPI0019522E1A|nr:VaFE repeat-containing surface-anchored protein [Corynebacterium macginleyi]QRP21161.1 VaFE repeat-containing surface-anchored protein [Corynebacterium macginleyi]
MQTRNLYDKANAEKLDIPAGFEDAAINVARHLMSAVAKKDSKSAANYSVYLAALVSKKPNSKTSAAATITGRDPKYGSQNHAIVNYPGFTGNHEDFTKLTGYKIVSDYDPVKFEKVQEVNIPPRPNGAFITVVKPQKDRQNRDQPVAPVDQPGLPPLEEEKPEKEQPKISTKAEFAEGDKQVVAGATVNDTVTYQDLVPGKQYTLDAQLVDKADSAKVIGSGSKAFEADKSGNGSVVVPIKVNEDLEGVVASAVAFETLKSQDQEAKDNKAQDLPEGSADDVIAEHKDPEDANQTVVSGEDQPAAIALKKYIGDQKFEGQEVPQAGGAGAPGVIDAQDKDNAYVAKKDQDLTVTFAVENTGKVDLKDVKVTDELITGEGFESSELSAISPEKQDIAQGETKYFTATLKAPAAGKFHGDKAKAAGTPVDENGKEIPWVNGDGERQKPGTPVESDEDPAHAKTSEPKNPSIATKAEFAEGDKQVVAGATVNDTVTYQDLVPGKQYTLDAQLVDKADSAKVIGSGSKAFEADKSGNGSVVVPIKVNEDLEGVVASAVAFETLKSQDQEAKDNKAQDLPEGSADDVIAEHKDPEDANQTVVSGEDQPAAIALKKYIGDQKFEGQEVPQAGGAGAPGVIDAQDKDNAYVAKKDQDLTVTFAVENTGKVDLKDVKVTDELITGEGFESSELSAISPEKQDIAQGETKYFTATLKAPAAGKFHGDKAKAAGTPVDENGKEIPWVNGDGERQKPGTPVESDEDPAHAKTSEPKNPSIATKAEFAEGDKQVVAGATVNDTVTYQDLVPGKQYTLDAQLVDKADSAKVIGSGSKAFEADKSGNGSVVVPIKVNEDLEGVVASAVAFETLKSQDQEAKDNKAQDLPEGSADDVIAEHKDPEDANQTVVSGEDQPAAIALKKYIGDQKFEGQEVPQAGGAGAPGVIDAQDKDNAYVAKKDQDLTVTFAVENTGKVDLKDVKVTDELITGEGFESSELSAISPEKQDIAQGETKYFTATLKAPAAGKFHGDKAKAAGTPVDENGKEIPWVNGDGERQKPGTPVESDEDPAHAKTSEPKNPSIATKAEFAEGDKQVVAGATVNDTVTYQDLVPGKQYTLDAQLVDKADSAKVIGSGSKAFEADKSGNGSVVVPIKVNEDLEGVVASAVAFETLKSQDQEAKDNKAQDLPEGSADDVIAEHKDPEDANQTVVSGEDQPAAIALKKYIGDQKFEGQEVPQAGGAGAPGVIDAQDKDNAYVAKKDQDLTVTFAVENTGKVDLKDVKVTDELITGEGFESSELSAISPEKQDIAQGETKYFTATLKAPAAGKFHGDKAKAAGTPVDENGKEIPWVNGDGERQKPGTPVESDEDPAHAKTSEPKNPSIATKAEFAEGDKQVVAGATVNDTVTYQDLVPGKQYTLDAQLVDKADSAKVIGSGSKAFEADKSGNGSVVVPIKVNEDLEGVVASAVAFETLKSQDQEAKDNKAQDLPEGSADDVIAEHKDPEDANQTVVSGEDQPAAIALKKYIGDQKFEGQEVPQAGGAGAPGVIDAQDKDNAYVAKKDQDLTVTFAVENTGKVDLKDVKVTDELITGEGFESSELSAISPEKQDIAQGETKYFTATLKAPAAGKFHGDKAKAAGTPVDENGKEIPWVNGDGERQKPGTPVESDEDPAHAKTSEPKKETTSESEPSESSSSETSKKPRPTKVQGQEPSEPETSSSKASATMKPSTTTSSEKSKEPRPTKVQGQEPSESPVMPKITTDADFAEGSHAVVAGAKIVDEVSYEGLVPGKEYTLKAELINKKDGKTVLGTGEKTFTPEKSAGKVDVEITVNADVTEPVEAAVAFEELTSTQVNAKGEETPDATPENPNHIAEHKDINDDDQTVVSKKDEQSPSKKDEKPKPNPEDKTDGRDERPGATVKDKDAPAKTDRGTGKVEQHVEINNHVPGKTGKPLPSDAKRTKIKSVPSGATELEPGMQYYIK